ncbi:MAG: hypothetical protein R3A45_05390 [Bdellovibrionota bacterium]
MLTLQMIAEKMHIEEEVHMLNENLYGLKKQWSPKQLQASVEKYLNASTTQNKKTAINLDGLYKM